MKFIKLCNIFYNLCKTAGKYHAEDVEKEIRVYKDYKYNDFLDALYELYKSHDRLYDILSNISANKQDDKFLNVIKNIKEDLPFLINQAKTMIGYDERMESDSIDILEISDKLFDMYFGIFPIETRKRSLENFTSIASYDLQYNLHTLLDKLFDQIIILL